MSAESLENIAQEIELDFLLDSTLAHNDEYVDPITADYILRRKNLQGIFALRGSQFTRF